MRRDMYAICPEIRKIGLAGRRSSLRMTLCRQTESWQSETPGHNAPETKIYQAILSYLSREIL
jgi:hypothetical protein